MVKVELDIRAQIANLNKGLDKTERQLKELGTQSDKTSKKIQGNMNQTNNSVKKLTSALGAMLTIGAAIQFTKAIIGVRAEFARFQAVLSNTLGSAEAANREFEKIKTFAAETPFSVRELTDSFVRLVNQGFKPTTRELKLLGDLAASTGKEFIQLTEAIIDAQVGEFERLKEFGIRASKQGDIVKFTFKEVETQVQFTASAIQGYILSLGNMEGVTGAMAKISETLGGRISNLGDSWDVLLNAMGARTEGVMFGVIETLSTVIDKVTELLELGEAEGRGKAKGKSVLQQLIIGEDEGGDIILDLELLNEELKRASAELKNMEGIGGIFLSDTQEEADAREDALLELQAYVQTLEDATLVEEERRKALEDTTVTIKVLQARIKELTEERKTLNIEDTEGLAIRNREIKALQEQIKELNKLGVAQKVKTPEVKDLVIDEGKGIIDLEKELADESLAIQTQLDQDILNSTKNRVDQETDVIIAAELQKRLLLDGTFEAIVAGLDLIGAANRDNAEIQQAVAIAQAIINGALGITKTGATLGYPLAIPFQIALGLQTLAQIALIRSQKFERGGYDVLSGRRHAQGGIQIPIGEGEDGEGHAVFSRQATQKYGKFLPAFVKAINEDKLNDVTDGGSYSFNYDDSRSVSELQGIRKLLSKKEIRYENGFRIETRNGQITKVKV